MKKLVLLIALLAACNGCGRGWLPFFRGDACGGGICGAPALPPAPAAPCAGCEGTYGANYPSYAGETVIGGSGYYDGQVLGETILGEIVQPGMSTGGSTIPPAIGAQ